MPFKDPEKRKEYNRDYSKTDKGRKSYRINNWKNKGIICKDFDKLYDTYINTNNCNWCNKDITKRRYI